ncbi:PLDc N-terminal domain-containing protein [Maritalea sp.]|uniref:PLDc N-terminal domain-containing protein n=1 Tax=Maritalea sp. TaxID=2003361 RepID=UPI003EF28F02
MGLEVGGLFGLIILIIDIWAILKIVKSGAPTLTKALWIIVILALPVLGLILWFLLGRSN